MTFAQEDLAALAAEEEIRIETRSAAGDVHRTIIWVVVEDSVVYIRSVKGHRGRWYRETLAEPSVVLHINRGPHSSEAARTIPARAVPASDAASVEACSAGLRTKYGTDPALKSMLRDRVLPTTLRLEAA